MRKSKTLKLARKRADRYLSIYIRLRDADEGLTVQCVTCGKLMYWKGDGAQAGHFVKSGKKATRYDERNVHVQGVKCNLYEGGREWEMGQYIDEKYGDGVAAELRTKGEEFQKVNIAWYDEWAAHFKQKIDDMGGIPEE